MTEIAEVRQIPLPPDTCVVSTPQSLSGAIVRALGPTPDRAEWLDPCVGAGSFVLSMRDCGVRPERITALDVDSACGPADEYAQTIRGVDFISWSLRSARAFDRIVANPPYVGLDRLNDHLLTAVHQLADEFELHLDGRGNYWLPFLLASIHLLRDGGSLGFVLPAAFEFSDYAQVGRSLLAKSFEQIHTVRSLRPLFPGVQDGCVVVIAQGRTRKAVNAANVVRTEVDGLDQIVSTLSSLPTIGEATTEVFHPTGRSTDFSDVAVLRIGAVTGDSRYFVLNEKQRQSLGLPFESVLPTLSRASDLAAPVFSERQWTELRDSGGRCWLFSPRNLNNPRVAAYAGLDLEQGGCRKTGWVQKRDPWYRVAVPGRIDGFISGMTKHGPRLTLNRMATLAATNTLYVVEFLSAKSLDERAAWSIALMSSQAQRQLFAKARLYPQGLRKLEPNDFASVALPTPNRVRGAHISLGTIWRRFDSDPAAARKVATNWCQKGSLRID